MDRDQALTQARHAYGIVGVGEIAEAIVTGLCDGVAQSPSVLLSPRNAQRAARLAACHATVAVAASNQDVLDGSEVVVLCVRPQDAAAILSPLRFAAQTPVVSVMAGIALDALCRMVAPAREVARAIPLPPVARRAGMTAVLPDSPVVRALFDPLGGCAPVADEDAFTALSTVTGTFSAHLEYLATITEWLRGQGMEAPLAERYVASAFAGLAPALSREPAGLQALSREYATPGGVNERFATLLREGGALELVGRSLDAIRDSLAARGS